MTSITVYLWPCSTNISTTDISFLFLNDYFRPGGHKEMSSILANQWTQMRRTWGGGGGLRGLSQWVQLCTWSPLWRSNCIFNLCFRHVYSNRLSTEELAWRPVAGLVGTMSSRQLIGWMRSAGLSASHVTRHQLTCYTDLQLAPAAGFIVELLGTLGRSSSICFTALKKISVMHVIKLGFAPVSFPPG